MICKDDKDGPQLGHCRNLAEYGWMNFNSTLKQKKYQDTKYDYHIPTDHSYRQPARQKSYDRKSYISRC